MPAYHYQALNSAGEEQKGVIEADNEREARQLLRERSLMPLQLRAARLKENANFSDVFSFLQRNILNDKSLALFTRQLAVLLSAGLPLEEALLAVAEQSEKARIKGLVLSVRAKVLEGHSLAAALRDFPNAFSGLFCATVAAGEKSGHLDTVLTRLADYTEQQSEMRQKLRTAMIYPTMIVLVAISIVGFLMQYVVPKMVGVYAQLQKGLPTLTSVLIGMSDFTRAYGLYILILLIVLIVLFRRTLRRSKVFQSRVHRVLLKLPLIGYAMRTADTARFSRTFAILSSSGVPVIEAMTIASQLISTLPIRDAVSAAVKKVREGGAIHLALKQTGYFSPMSVHMVASGEASGQVENMLDRVASTQETEITRLIDVGLALFEPAVILIMGGVVLFIVLAILLPILQLNQLG